MKSLMVGAAIAVTALVPGGAFWVAQDDQATVETVVELLEEAEQARAKGDAAREVAYLRRAVQQLNAHVESLNTRASGSVTNSVLQALVAEEDGNTGLVGALLAIPEESNTVDLQLASAIDAGDALVAVGDDLCLVECQFDDDQGVISYLVRGVEDEKLLVEVLAKTADPDRLWLLHESDDRIRVLGRVEDCDQLLLGRLSSSDCETETQTQKSQVPILGDIPLIGRLFESQETVEAADVSVSTELISPLSARLDVVPTIESGSLVIDANPVLVEMAEGDFITSQLIFEGVDASADRLTITGEVDTVVSETKQATIELVVPVEEVIMFESGQDSDIVQVRGRVVDAQGAPVHGANVSVSCKVEQADPDQAVVVQSDASGRFVIEQLVPGRYTVEVKPSVTPTVQFESEGVIRVVEANTGRLLEERIVGVVDTVTTEMPDTSSSGSGDDLVQALNELRAEIRALRGDIREIRKALGDDEPNKRRRSLN